MPKRRAINPNRIRVFEPLRTGIVMLTRYEGKRPREVGNVSYLPHSPSNSRPGGAL